MTPYIRFCSCQLNAAALIQRYTENSSEFKEIQKVNPKSCALNTGSKLLIVWPLQKFDSSFWIEIFKYYLITLLTFWSLCQLFYHLSYYEDQMLIRICVFHWYFASFDRNVFKIPKPRVCLSVASCWNPCRGSPSTHWWFRK